MMLLLEGDPDELDPTVMLEGMRAWEAQERATTAALGEEGG